MAKADWHTHGLTVDSGDPFAADGQKEEEPFPLLCQAVKREAALRHAGASCAIRDNPDACCHACPVKGSKGELCKVGLEIERLSTRLVADGVS